MMILKKSMKYISSLELKDVNNKDSQIIQGYIKQALNNFTNSESDYYLAPHELKDITNLDFNNIPKIFGV